MQNICKKNFEDVKKTIDKYSNFFIKNNFILSPWSHSSSLAFDAKLQLALDGTKLLFDSIIQNTSYQNKIYYHLPENFERVNYNTLNWDTIAIHCLMTTYELLFQMTDHDYYSFTDAPMRSIDEAFTRNSELGKSLANITPSISTKRICSLRTQLHNTDLENFFPFCKNSTDKIRRKPLLNYEIPLIFSITAAPLLPLCNDDSEDIDKIIAGPNMNHQLRKRLEIYNKNRKSKHQLSNYDLLMTLPNSNSVQQFYFFPGYYPVEELVNIDIRCKNLTAFDYYINYKLESIFNIETAYMMREYFTEPRFSASVHGQKSNATMGDFSSIASCQAIYLRSHIFQDIVNFLPPYEQSKKPFKLFDIVTDPTLKIQSYELGKLFDSKEEDTVQKYDQFTRHLNIICDHLSNFLIPLCEWVFFTQLNVQGFPSSWKGSQEHFLSMFRKHFFNEFGNKKRFILDCMENETEEEEYSGLNNPSEESLLQRFISPKHMDDATDFITCLQALTEQSKNQSFPLSNIDWSKAPEGMIKREHDHPPKNF